MNARRFVIAFCGASGLLIAACGTQASPRSQPITPSSGPSTTGVPTATTTATTATTATTRLPQTTVALSTTTTVASLPLRPGAERLHFEVGPLTINPGQNNIDLSRSVPQPTVDGWIVGMNPNLRLADGSVPPVDVVHLHHGVWLNAGAKDATAALPERLFAVGEEKTILELPEPFGYRYKTSDHWVLTYMLHNLLATATQVWITYDIDFVRATAEQSATMIAARPIWMDVQNGKGYPVFDVLKGNGSGGTFTYPTQADKPYGTGPSLNQWTVDRDGVLINTAVHLHPGGLYGDLSLQRGAKSAHLFKSDAKYFEPAGAVSWDVAMTATPQDWRVAVKAGDVLSITATYDSALASWYESMGIMVVWMADTAPVSTDPFTTPVDAPGMLTHGHLPENDHHGGQPDSANYVDLTRLPSAPVGNGSTIDIQNFVYGEGDMTIAQSVPTVKPGGTITFDNLDNRLFRGVWHTITACKAPCNKTTGIAYPLADGDVTFDSGELGLGGPPTADRNTWTVPATLTPGTYTYFCRIHPLMRGAFRVEQ
jgi:plastocyanin